ncbi:hypothetical protein BLOT_012726 [Blomia tropicalis]|nr:hypothetical protein BLOT_012726 [Blomia tropicalis]
MFEEEKHRKGGELLKSYNVRFLVNVQSSADDDNGSMTNLQSGPLIQFTAVTDDQQYDCHKKLSSSSHYEQG